MRRTTRLFELIQILRGARRPLTAQVLAGALEVTKRTIYRDVASLQALAVPIQGEAGVGYVMRAGYDLPPLMLSVEEVEALVVALALLQRTGDRGLKVAAGVLQAKIGSVLPLAARRPIQGIGLMVSDWGSAEPSAADPVLLRQAVREELKLAIDYRDAMGAATRRTILPIAMIYYVEVMIIAAWCELRGAFRHFRADRVEACALAGGDFRGQAAYLRLAWAAGREAAGSRPLPVGSSGAEAS